MHSRNTISIKARLTISAATTILLIFILGALLLQHSFQIRHELRKSSIATQLLKNTTDILLITEEYMFYHYQRYHQQWMMLYSTIEILLASFPDKENITAVQQELDTLNYNFSRLQDEIELSHALRQSDAPSTTIERSEILMDLLSAQVRFNSRSILAGIFAISGQTEQRIQALEASGDKLLLTFAGLIIFIITVSSLLTLHSITNPLSALVLETNRIEKGERDLNDLDEAPMRMDEIGRLGAAIRSMSRHLITSMRELDAEIKEREKAEENIANALREKETLLREIYHRTKNNMQVINSMLLLQAYSSENADVKRIIEETGHKIQAMALVHEKLYQSQDLSRINLKEYIEELVRLLFSGYQLLPDQVDLSMELESITVEIDTAIPCGLVLNELISNVLKYAFPDGRTGSVAVRLTHTSTGLIALQVVDSGIGVPAGFKFREQQSLGMQTIFAIVEQQLNGQILFSSENGLACCIEFPVNSLNNPDLRAIRMGT